MRGVILLFVLAFFLSPVCAQSCSIQSDSIVCKGELITFTPNPASTANSYNWTFGDGSSSTQQSASHSYSSTGKKTVNLIITYADGTKCSTSKEINVHALPIADFDINGLEFCLNTQNICLDDNSSMGGTTTGYSKRIILWGDGSINNPTNPAIGDLICFSNYPNPGNYTIDVEIENDKGCEARWEEDIVIKADYKGSFTYILNQADCNRQKVSVSLDTFTDLADIDSIIWNYGDGTIDSGNNANTFHYYSNPGTYKVKLIVKIKNGCERTIQKNVNVFFVKVKANVTPGDSVQCYPLPFLFFNPHISGAVYYWDLLDSNKNFMVVAAYGNRPAIKPPYPGDFYVRMRVQLGTCIDTSRLFKIEAVGVLADFDALNRKQCILEDTVYFLNKSLVHPDARPVYLWNFNDSDADQTCSTSVLNCNYDTLYNSKHWYLDTGCYFPKLYAYDPVSGCIDSNKLLVALQPIEAAEFEYNAPLPCRGTQDAFAVHFGHKLCDAQVSIIFDSCTRSWYDFRSPAVYSQTCDSNGWVTVGFAVEAGDSVIYRSADSNDFYYDGSRVCIDTIWFHNWFQLHQAPKALFQFSREDCLPVNVAFKYVGNDSLSLVNAKVRWDYPWTNDSTSYNLSFDTVPDLKHTYYQEKEYWIKASITDTFGCFDVYEFREDIGFFNFMRFDSFVCANEEVLFVDSNRYWNDTVSYWRQNNGKDLIRWNFGDKPGFDSTGPLMRYSYDANGEYIVTMVSEDKNGCTDTIRKKIYVGGVKAAVKLENTEFLCDQITQFFDSSYLVQGNASDSISEYVWYFGDGSIESYVKNPFHFYNTNGVITVTHAVNTKSGCTDTTRFDIYLNGPQPYFDIVSDSVGCVPFTASFKSNSTRVSSYVWHFGDNQNTTQNLDKDSTIEFTYTEPGVYYIYLEGIDSFYNTKTKSYYSCQAVYPDTTALNPILKRIIVLPVPIVGIATDEPYCEGQEVTIWSVSDPKYSNFNWQIDGVDVPTNNDTIRHTFNIAGNHSIRLNPSYQPIDQYDRECFDSSELIINVSSLTANFNYERIENCSEFQFTDSSVNASNYSWDFDHGASGGDNYSDLANPTHNYKLDTGTFEVCLYIRNPEGCKDTACKEIKATYFELLKMYNVFTPGVDGLNDEFIVEVENYDLFDLKIFNRWGELVFKSTDPTIYWKGSYFNEGELLPSSTYFYILNYSFECTDENYQMEGTIDLIQE